MELFLCFAIFLNDICLEDISLFDIVELCKSHTALIALGDLFDVVFETFEAIELIISDNYTVTDYADIGASRDLAFKDITTGNSTDVADLIYLADLRSSEIDITEFRRKR